MGSTPCPSSYCWSCQQQPTPRLMGVLAFRGNWPAISHAQTAVTCCNFVAPGGCPGWWFTLSIQNRVAAIRGNPALDSGACTHDRPTSCAVRADHHPQMACWHLGLSPLPGKRFANYQRTYFMPTRRCPAFLTQDSRPAGTPAWSPHAPTRGAVACLMHRRRRDPIWHFPSPPCLPGSRIVRYE